MSFLAHVVDLTQKLNLLFMRDKFVKKTLVFKRTKGTSQFAQAHEFTKLSWFKVVSLVPP